MRATQYETSMPLQCLLLICLRLQVMGRAGRDGPRHLRAHGPSRPATGVPAPPPLSEKRRPALNFAPHQPFHPKMRGACRQKNLPLKLGNA